MNYSQGFSLIEVLLSLFLTATVALGLASQQWQMTHFFNQVLLKNDNLRQEDNVAERSRASLSYYE